MQLALLVLSLSQIQPAEGVLVNVDELALLSNSSAEWLELDTWAHKNLTWDLSDMDSRSDVVALAAALVYARNNDLVMRSKAIQAVNQIQGTEDAVGTDTLAVGRNLFGYIITADILKQKGVAMTQFDNWLANDVTEQYFQDSPTVTRRIRDTHTVRPNNWGTMCGATRVAYSVYLNDQAEFDEAVTVWKSWLGDQNIPNVFEYQGAWQTWTPWLPPNHRPVNQPGDMVQGQNVDGVVIDDQDRCGAFAWPP